MRQEKLAIGGSVGASLAVASCCIAPALYLLFGVSAGALGQLTMLEPYRPLFIGVGGLALTYAGFRIPWRSRRIGDCEDEACVQARRPSRWTRRLFVTAAILFIVAVTYPYFIEIFA